MVELSYQGETTADHIIRNNYCYNITPKDDFASNQGDSKTILVAFNTIYNADDPIFFNDRDNNVFSGTIAHNLVYSSDGQLVEGDFANTGASMTYAGNIFGGSTVVIPRLRWMVC